VAIAEGIWEVYAAGKWTIIPVTAEPASRNWPSKDVILRSHCEAWFALRLDLTGPLSSPASTEGPFHYASCWSEHAASGGS
jgi:hypothetical protein